MSERLSQRVLVYELKHAIDRVRRAPWDTRARRHLIRLVSQNMHAIDSTHVRYNIGKSRREWMDENIRI